MKTNTRDRMAARRGRMGWLVLSLTMLLATGGCMQLMRVMRGDVQPPPAEEFGFGPRSSENGLFRATIDPVQPIRVGRMQTMRLHVANGDGQGIDGARIAVDGGMPQHGHGLPTRPRVTRDHGGGSYDVEGMKFNMGGWWVVKFHVTTEAGADSVVFNLDL